VRRLAKVSHFSKKEETQFGCEFPLHVDLSYGGVYADMDYLALQSHEWFFGFMEQNNVSVLFSNEISHTIAFEWGMAARPKHRVW